MRSALLLPHWLVVLFLLPAHSFAITFTSVGTGNWNNPATWSTSPNTPGAWPGDPVRVGSNTDAVVISGAIAHTVTYNVTAANVPAGTTEITIATLTFNAGGVNTTLAHAAGTLPLHITGGVTINQPTANARTHLWAIDSGTATVDGTISFAGTNTTSTRKGTIRMSSGTLNAYGGISFVGTTPATKNIETNVAPGTAVINLKGALSGAAGATLTAGTSGAIFNYADTAVAQTFETFGSGAYNQLHFSNTSASGVTSNTAITATNVTGSIRVLSGKFTTSAPITGGAGDTFELAAGTVFEMTGTGSFPTGFSTFTLHPTSIVRYKQTAASTVAAQNYGFLEIIPAANVTMTLAAGTLGVAGNLTVGDGVNTPTVDWNTNDPAINLKGNFLLNSPSVWIASNIGTLTWSPNGTATFTDNNATKQDIGIISISGGLSVPTVNPTTDMKATSVSIAAGHTLTITGSNKLTLTGTGTVFSVTGTFNPSTGTVEYTGAGAVTVSATTYYDLNFAPTTGANITYTAGGAIICNNNFTSNPTFTALATLTFNLGGSFTVANTITLTGSGTAGSKSLLNTTATNYPVTTSILNITAFGTLTCNGSTITVTGAGTPFTQGGTFNANTSTFVYNNDGNVNVAAETYNNLTLSPTITAPRTYATLGVITLNGNLSCNPSAATAQTMTVKLGGNLSVAGTATLGGGGTGPATTIFDTTISNFSLTAASITINAGSTLTANGSTITVTGTGAAFTPTGTFNANTSTFFYNGNGATTIAATTYHNLTFSPTIAAAQTYTSAGAITCTGSFTSNPSSAAANTLTFNLGGSFSCTGSITLTGTGAGPGRTSMNTSATGNYDVSCSTLTIDALSTLTANSSNITVTASGVPFTLSGTFASNTSTFKYTGNAATTITPATYFNLQVLPSANGVTHTFAAGSFTINGNLTAGNGINTGTVTAAVNSTTLSVIGDMNISAGTTFVAHATNGFNVGGSWTNNGTFTANGGTVTFDPSLSTLKSIGGTLTGTSAFNNVVFNSVNGNWQFTASADVTGNFTLTTGSLTAPAGTLTITGNFSNSGTFTHNSGTVIFNGTAGTQIIGGSQNTTFFNFTHTTAANIKFGDATTGLRVFSVAGTFTWSDGSMEIGNAVPLLTDTLALTNAAAANSSITIPLAKSITMNGGSEIQLTGNWNDSGGVFTPTAGTVTLNGTSAQSLTSAAGNNFFNLTISKTTGIASASSNLNINGSLSVSSGTFNPNNNTITIGGNSSVSSGAVLTLSGTPTIKFAAGVTLTVNGKINASGGTLQPTVAGNAYRLFINPTSSTDVINITSLNVTNNAGAVNSNIGVEISAPAAANWQALNGLVINFSAGVGKCLKITANGGTIDSPNSTFTGGSTAANSGGNVEVSDAAGNFTIIFKKANDLSSADPEGRDMDIGTGRAEWVTDIITVVTNSGSESGTPERAGIQRGVTEGYAGSNYYTSGPSYVYAISGLTGDDKFSIIKTATGTIVKEVTFPHATYGELVGRPLVFPIQTAADGTVSFDDIVFLSTGNGANKARILRYSWDGVTLTLKNDFEITDVSNITGPAVSDFTFEYYGLESTNKHNYTASEAAAYVYFPGLDTSAVPVPKIFAVKYNPVGISGASVGSLALASKSFTEPSVDYLTVGGVTKKYLFMGTLYESTGARAHIYRIKLDLVGGNLVPVAIDDFAAVGAPDGDVIAPMPEARSLYASTTAATFSAGSTTTRRDVGGSGVAPKVYLLDAISSPPATFPGTWPAAAASGVEGGAMWVFKNPGAGAGLLGWGDNAGNFNVRKFDGSSPTTASVALNGAVRSFPQTSINFDKFYIGTDNGGLYRLDLDPTLGITGSTMLYFFGSGVKLRDVRIVYLGGLYISTDKGVLYKVPGQ